MTDDVDGGANEGSGGAIEENNIYSIEAARLKKRSPKTHKDDEGFIRGAEGGIIKTHPHNVRLAINRLGVTLRYNEFTNCPEINGLPNYGPDLTEAAGLRLRFSISETYQFYPARELFNETVDDLAFNNRYHPVREWLNGLTWDGTKRIDTWLIDYAGAEDNAFDRAVSRLWFIAGVRRVRKPRVKFDTLLTLESSQGLNKSSTASVLAVKPEWFNDCAQLGADPKEAIEQLSEAGLQSFPN
jgi:hypothetical protein